MTTFFVPGEPAPQGSKTYVGHRRLIESSKKVAAWRAAVKLVAGNQHKHFDGPVTVEIEFVMHRPQSHGKTRQKPMIEHPDVDKLIRSTLDGMTESKIFPNDSHVVTVKGHKRRARSFTEPTGAFITIKEEQC